MLARFKFEVLHNIRHQWDENTGPILQWCHAKSVGKLVKCNYTGNVRITQHRRAFVQPFLQCKIKKYYIFWVCICSLRYPACNARVPYCHLWPAPPHEIFTLYPINGPISKKRLLNIKSVFVFCRTLVWNISHSKKNWVRHDKRYTLTFMQNTRHFCPKLMKLEFSRKIMEKYSNIKSVQWEPSCSMRNDTNTDGQTWRS